MVDHWSRVIAGERWLPSQDLLFIVQVNFGVQRSSKLERGVLRRIGNERENRVNRE